MRGLALIFYSESLGINKSNPGFNQFVAENVFKIQSKKVVENQYILPQDILKEWDVDDYEVIYNE